MRLLLSLIVILSIPYSAALAQNSNERGSLFLGKQSPASCATCGKSLTTSSQTGKRPQPVNIKGMIAGTDSGMRTRTVYRQKPTTYTMGGIDRTTPQDRLAALSAENQRNQYNSAMALGAQRDADVRALQQSLAQQQNYYQRQTETPSSSGKSSAGGQGTRTYDSVVYRGAKKDEPSASSPGSRVFLSPR